MSATFYKFEADTDDDVNCSYDRYNNFVALCVTMFRSNKDAVCIFDIDDIKSHLKEGADPKNYTDGYVRFDMARFVRMWKKNGFTIIVVGCGGNFVEKIDGQFQVTIDPTDKINVKFVYDQLHDDNGAAKSVVVNQAKCRAFPELLKKYGFIPADDKLQTLIDKLDLLLLNNEMQTLVQKNQQ